MSWNRKHFCDVGDYHLYVEKKDSFGVHNCARGDDLQLKTPASGSPLANFRRAGRTRVFRNDQGITLLLREGHIEEISTTDPNRWFYTTFSTYTLLIPFENSKSATYALAGRNDQSGTAA